MGEVTLAGDNVLESIAIHVLQEDGVWLGKLDRSDLPTVVPAIAAASFGAFTGLHLLHRMSDRLVRRLVLWFVVACGLRYLWAALM